MTYRQRQKRTDWHYLAGAVAGTALLIGVASCEAQAATAEVYNVENGQVLERVCQAVDQFIAARDEGLFHVINLDLDGDGTKDAQHTEAYNPFVGVRVTNEECDT